AARLALIVHFLRWACGEVGCEDVDGESMDIAARLVAYFKSHARKVYAVIDADPKTGLTRRLLQWLAEKGMRQITRRDAYRAMRGACQTVDEIDPLLSLLEKHGYLRLVPGTQDRPGTGRKPSPAYEIHPSIPGQNGHNGQNSDDD